MEPAIDSALFRETLGHYPTGVAVVTGIAADGNPAGMVVGTFTSVSLDPPLVAFFPTASSGAFAYLRTASAFCVNVLAADQEPLCRQLATGGATKFDGVPWRPGSLGSPVLDGAVSWIECTFEDIREAGDHFIVLGRVRDLGIQRSTLPLLFFQGGYGRFSPRSLIAAPAPDLIQAARLAEIIRPQVEALSTEFALNCSVLARIGWDVVQVLTADNGALPETFPLGHRMPIIPPLGSVFVTDAPPDEVDEWVRRSPDDGHRDELFRTLLDKVRERGYSLLTAEPERLQRHSAVLTAFETSDRLPRHERAVAQATAELVDLYNPELQPGERYNAESIVVPIPVPADFTPLALRMTGLPSPATTEQLTTWITRLKEVAASASLRL